MFCKILVLSVFIASGSTSIAQESGDQPRPSVSSVSACNLNSELQALLDLHNVARSKGVRCGGVRKPSVPKLKYSCELAKASLTHSNDMSQNNILSHTGSDGSSIGVRATRAAYEWRQLGENIAEGFRSSQSVNTAWLSSTGHCNNIMSAGYTEMGAARVNNYWTVMFGRQ